MKRAFLTACFVLLVVTLGGCGSKADSLTKEAIANTNDLADALESSASSARIEEIYKRQDETNKRLSELKLSEDEKKKLVEKYKATIDPATEKLMEALKKSSIKRTNDLADAYENGATTERKKEIVDAREELKKKLDELKLSEEQRKNLEEKYRDEATKAEQRLKRALQ